MSLPLTIEALNAQWLDSALKQRDASMQVHELVLERVIPGTTTKVLVRARISDAVDAVPRWVRLCIKGGFDASLRPLFGSSYVSEARFYAEVAGAIDAPLPRSWYAAADAQAGQGIVIMDDLAAAGAGFGDPSAPWAADKVAQALAVQARWQAQTWGARPEQFPSLVVGSYVRQPATMLFSQDNWAASFSDPEHAQRMPPALRDRQRVHEALLRMWQIDDEQGIACLSHSDPHIGNTFMDANGVPGFLDWQSASLAPAMDDVAYFLVGAMTVADRRQHERALLTGYQAQLEQELGQRLDSQALWTDYQRHCLHGLVWTVVPPQLQPEGYRALMTERYVAAVMDHDSLSLL